MKRRFEIGKVAGGHGTKGELKVYPISDDPDNLLAQESFYIDDVSYRVRNARKNGRFIILSVEGINTRDEADSYRNSMVALDRENASPLLEGQVYIEDIIGCAVYEESTLIGTVSDVMKTGANDVYVIECAGGKELLVPAVKDYVKAIDIANRRLEIVVPEGLTENVDF